MSNIRGRPDQSAHAAMRVCVLKKRVLEIAGRLAEYAHSEGYHPADAHFFTSPIESNDRTIFADRSMTFCGDCARKRLAKARRTPGLDTRHTRIEMINPIDPSDWLRFCHNCDSHLCTTLSCNTAMPELRECLSRLEREKGISAENAGPMSLVLEAAAELSSLPVAALSPACDSIEAALNEAASKAAFPSEPFAD